MNSETRKAEIVENAILGSILHWEDNLYRAKRGWPINVSPYGCDLCKLFRGAEGFFFISLNSCKGCPISCYTGLNFCANTPYLGAAKNESAEDCQREVDFLGEVLNWFNQIRHLW